MVGGSCTNDTVLVGGFSFSHLCNMLETGVGYRRKSMLPTTPAIEDAHSDEILTKLLVLVAIDHEIERRVDGDTEVRETQHHVHPGAPIAVHVHAEIAHVHFIAIDEELE